MQCMVNVSTIVIVASPFSSQLNITKKKEESVLRREKKQNNVVRYWLSNFLESNFFYDVPDEYSL